MIPPTPLPFIEENPVCLDKDGCLLGMKINTSLVLEVVPVYDVIDTASHKHAVVSWGSVFWHLWYESEQIHLFSLNIYTYTEL